MCKDKVSVKIGHGPTLGVFDVDRGPRQGFGGRGVIDRTLKALLGIGIGNRQEDNQDLVESWVFHMNDWLCY